MNTVPSRDTDRHPTGAEAAELLDVKGVGLLLHCSGRHVYRLRDSGAMPPPLQLGRLVRWRRAELMEWLDARCPPQRSARGGLR